MNTAVQAVVATMIAAAVIHGVGFAQTSKGSKSDTITATEAEKFVYAMLKADDWTKLPGFTIASSTDPDYPNFYLIDATHSNTSGGGTVGHFAVERTTGDVWNALTCGRYTSPTLTRLQQAARNRMGLTIAAYERLRKPGPSCLPGEQLHVLEMGKPTIADTYIDPNGNVQVSYSDGTGFQPPKEKEQASCSSPAVAVNKMAAGWLVEKVVCCQPYPIPTMLVVYRLGKPLRYVDSGMSMVSWLFLEDGAQVAFLSDRSHGTSAPHYGLLDVETGRLIDKWDGELTDKAPAWAQWLQ